MRNMQPFITINKKSGQFFMNRAAANLWQLCQYDRIEIFQNKENPTLWQAKKVDEGGFCLVFKDGIDNNGFLFINKKKAAEILNSVGFEDNSVRVPVEAAKSIYGWQWLLKTDSLLD